MSHACRLVHRSAQPCGLAQYLSHRDVWLAGVVADTRAVTATEGRMRARTHDRTRGGGARRPRHGGSCSWCNRRSPAGGRRDRRLPEAEDRAPARRSGRLGLQVRRAGPQVERPRACRSGWACGTTRSSRPGGRGRAPRASGHAGACRAGWAAGAGGCDGAGRAGRRHGPRRTGRTCRTGGACWTAGATRPRVARRARRDDLYAVRRLDRHARRRDHDDQRRRAPLHGRWWASASAAGRRSRHQRGGLRPGRDGR